MKSHHVALPLAIASSLLAVAVPGNAGATQVVKFDLNPTAAQDAAIRRAAAAEIADFIHHDRDGYAVGQADLNDDGRADLLVHYSDISFCGSSGCSGAIVMATKSGYATKSIGLPNFGARIEVLDSKHLGMRDLHFDDASYVFHWDGKEYR